MPDLSAEMQFTLEDVQLCITAMVRVWNERAGSPGVEATLVQSSFARDVAMAVLAELDTAGRLLPASAEHREERVLTKAYWKLREHASSLRSTTVYRKASERAEGAGTLTHAYQRYLWLEATARGIEDGAQDIAEMLGVPENEIEPVEVKETAGEY